MVHAGVAQSGREDAPSQPPPFPVPDFDGPTVVFGADNGAYLTREQLGDWYGCYGANSRTPYHKAVEGLLFQGGKLGDYGLAVKPDLDRVKVMSAIRGLMGSFAPKHEIKVGTVAWALHEWCDLLGDGDGTSSTKASSAMNPK